MTDKKPEKAKVWETSSETVEVRCPEHKELRGVAAKNAVGDKVPLRFRAMCPNCDAENVATPLEAVKKND